MFDPARLPRPGDAAAAERGLQRWPRSAERLPPDLAGAAAPDGARPELRPLLEAVFGNSPFLSEALLAEPDVLARFLRDGPDPVRDDLLAEAAATPLGQRARVAAALRRSRRRMALLVALADLTGAWPLEAVTGALTAFADACVGRALAQLVAEAAARGELEPDADPDRTLDGCGLVVLGMGKLGAFELNYSSDIDLIVLFDPGRLRARSREGPLAVSVRLTRSLVHLLDARTKDGYVFRTDLRLRPHPAGQPLALSVDDALFYYEHHGQNWERAALIKARPVAGDLAVGAEFLRQLRPYLWRKHLDYAAIADIQSIKRQINAHRGHGTIKVLGHDIKVGRGGIREIEFFAQTQQLILGGRIPELRAPDTCGALRALAAARWVAPDIADELIAAYGFLRRVEHRLQMVNDRQTHSLPEREDQLERFAAFMGYRADGGAAALDRDLRRHLGLVEGHYASLFEASPDLGAGGILVFTGVEDDPGTLETLAGMGFARPEVVARRLREWHHGHIRATRSARARELLTEIAPGMLRALAAQAEPDAAFERFDAFVGSLPEGVQPFSLFRANPRLLDLIADLMGVAPRLGQSLRFDASLFEAMLAPDLMEPLPDRAALAAELDRALAQAADLQDALDLARRWLHRRQFQLGLQVLLGVTFGDRAGGTLSDLAELVIRALLPEAARWLARQHGRPPPGGALVVLGLGKLGSRELTIGSDLDLIFVYDAPDPDARSDGDRPLAAGGYFARLGQRLVSALTAQTPEGRLYDIDTRLRPSGNAGPVATSAEGFARYQRETAQTWEHQALTRARVVAGHGDGADALAERVAATVRAELARPRDPAALGRDVAAMRERIFREHGGDDPWNLKHVRGGLVDVEFIAQLVQLRHAAEHPAILRANTADALAAAGQAGVLPAAEAEALARSAKLYQRLQAVLRLSVGDRFAAADAPRGLREALCRAAAAGGPPVDFGHLEQDLRAAQAEVRRVFDRLCAAAHEHDEETPRR